MVSIFPDYLECPKKDICVFSFSPFPSVICSISSLWAHGYLGWSLFRCLFSLSHLLTFYLFPYLSLSIYQSHFVSLSLFINLILSLSLFLSPSLSPSNFLHLYFPLSSSLSLSHSRSLEISVIFSRITHCLALRLWVQQLLLFWQLWSKLQIDPRILISAATSSKG